MLNIRNMQFEVANMCPFLMWLQVRLLCHARACPHKRRPFEASIFLARPLTRIQWMFHLLSLFAITLKIACPRLNPAYGLIAPWHPTLRSNMTSWL